MDKKTINSKQSLEDVIEILRQLQVEFGYFEIEIKALGGLRTRAQNRALHKYFELLADALNDAGYDQRKTLKPDVDIPWTKDAVKTMLWHPLQKAITGEESTARVKTSDYPKVYEVLNRHTAQKLGVSAPWPCEDK